MDSTLYYCSTYAYCSMDMDISSPVSSPRSSSCSFPFLVSVSAAATPAAAAAFLPRGAQCPTRVDHLFGRAAFHQDMAICFIARGHTRFVLRNFVRPNISSRSGISFPIQAYQPFVLFTKGASPYIFGSRCIVAVNSIYHNEGPSPTLPRGVLSPRIVHLQPERYQSNES